MKLTLAQDSFHFKTSLSLDDWNAMEAKVTKWMHENNVGIQNCIAFGLYPYGDESLITKKRILQ